MTPTERLNAERKLKGLIAMHHGSQVEFAKKVGMAGPKLNRIIKGHEPIDDKAKKRWAKLLKSDVAEIFGD